MFWNSFDEYPGDGKHDGDKSDKQPSVLLALNGCDKIITAMNTSWKEECHYAACFWGTVPSTSGITLCKTIPGPHEYAETGVAWNSCYRADQSCPKAISENITNIFPQSQTQWNESSVYTPVKLTIKCWRGPSAFLQKEIFESLFETSYHNKIRQELIDKGARQQWYLGKAYPPIQPPCRGRSL